ncbi:MAG: hypothetical protein JKY08_07520 [Flavobacteriaceae bacterium]|nr:hypothetical protein [Flavobacteriaceae bacterium]
MNRNNFSKLDKKLQSITMIEVRKKIGKLWLISILIFSSVSLNANPIAFGFLRNLIISKMYSHHQQTNDKAYPVGQKEEVFLNDSGNIEVLPVKVVAHEFATVADECTDLASTDGTPTASDSDGDGINDICDLDDDNDGIIDTDEGCGVLTSGPIRVVFVLDTSGSISYAEYDAMTVSINNVATTILEDEPTTEIAVIQYGGGGDKLEHTAIVSRGFSVTHPSWTASKRASMGGQDHLPSSLFNVRSFWEAGGELDLTLPGRVSFVIFTDAYKAYSYACCSILSNIGGQTNPNALPDYGEYDFIKITYDARFLIGHHSSTSPGGYEAATAIASYDNNGNLLVNLGGFSLSESQVTALAYGATFGESPDFDVDEVENCNDLDSDNDGIYDIVESGDADIAALDTNNNGRLDAGDSAPFQDLNANGLDDRIEAKYGDSTGITVRKTISNRPDYTNLDSDGDTCFDTDEAYLDKNTNLDGGGEYGNADTKTVSDPEIDFDGTVVAASYQSPATTISGQYTFQSATAISAIGMPIMVSDCTGPDVTIKAIGTTTILATNTVTTASTDLSYQWYENDVLMVGESGTVASGAEVSLVLEDVTLALSNNNYKVVFVNEGNICEAEATIVLTIEAIVCNPCIYGASTDGDSTVSDSDGDGINNSCDLDDDNDGILDLDEGGCLQPTTTVGALRFSESGVENAIALLGLPDGLVATMDKEGYLEIELSENITEGEIVNLIITRGSASGNFIIEAGIDTVTWSNPVAYNESSGASLNNLEIVPYTIAAGGAKYIKLTRIAGVLEIDAVTFEILCIPLDTDGDSIPDQLDSDSDNDGCPDALEGGDGFTPSDLSLNHSLTGGVATSGANIGVPIVTSNGDGQTVGSSQNNMQFSVATIANQLGVLIGSNITFTSVVTGTSVIDFFTAPETIIPVDTGFLYQWYVSTDNGITYTEIDGATSSEYSLSNVSSDNDGMYKVIVTHPGNSCPIEQVAMLTVIPCELVDTLVVTSSSLTTCSPGNEGEIIISEGGLSANTEYKVTYKKEGDALTTVSPNPSTDASGKIVLTGLSAGEYTMITVENPSSSTCAASIENTITLLDFENTLLVNVTKIDETVFEGNNGSITIIPTGGTPNYIISIQLEGSATELWTGETTNNLVPGKYTILVIDAKGCQYEEQQIIEKISACAIDVNITPSKTAISCFGDTDITLTATSTIPTGSSATLPLTYVWTNGAGIEIGTSDSVSGLGAGTYKVVVTSVVSGVSCEGAQETFTITQPVNALTANISSSDVTSVSPGNEGVVSVEASGGTAPYTYVWLDSLGNEVGTTKEVTGLTVGTYSVIVKDANNCVTASLETTIAGLGCFTIHNVSGNKALKCHGDTTNLRIDLGGASTDTTITWTTTDGDLTGIAINGLTLIGVGAGTYKATVVDNVLSCTKTIILNITENASLSGAIDVGQVECKGASTGTLDLSITGGAGNYTYLWSSATVDLSSYTTTNQDLIAVPAGAYQVLIKDGNDCELTILESVVEPSTMVSITNVEAIKESCSNCNDGQIIITSEGGTGEHSYSIDNGVTRQTSPTFSSLSPGVYKVTVYDANGCFVSKEGVEIIEDVLPDFKPVVYSGNTQIDENGNIDFVVLIGELRGNNSRGITPLEFNISKDPNVLYAFDATITSQGGGVVNNSDWVLDDSNVSYLRFKYIGNSGVFIGDTASYIGLSAHLIAPDEVGVFPVTVIIMLGAGGEVRMDNNIDVEYIKYTK